ncbi:hypothetical protein C5748_01960 [Phyllobacterium phragmitis]|uniref:Uncharacterized protein n=1 Tax=Phyllobacterium phragmitis TaxID=2670329 RepID=A0A2S9IZG3_9HYPH|nr:hypothetical protein C5748_01960 [Phyllobacterium phragmitis]
MRILLLFFFTIGRAFQTWERGCGLAENALFTRRNIVPKCGATCPLPWKEPVDNMAELRCCNMATCQTGTYMKELAAD